MTLRRRTLLCGFAGLGAAGLGMAGLAGCGGQDVEVTGRWHYSAARGKRVNLVAMIPSGLRRESLGVCLVLHGRFSNAAGMIQLGMADFLGEAVHGGVPPFAMVAVDGDSTYWVRGDIGADDPQRMLRAELPGWLRALGLRADGGVPRSALGMSMGGFGALVYARHNPRPPRAAALLSPGLLATFGEARRKEVYTREASWQAAAPLRHLDALPSQTRLGVWCGTQDRFFPVASELARRVHPELARFPRGGHNEDFWHAVLPEVLSFLGRHTAKGRDWPRG